MSRGWRWQWAGMAVVFSLMWGCAVNSARLSPTPEEYRVVPPEEFRAQTQLPRESASRDRKKPDNGWTYRVITEAELERLSAKDPDLSPSFSRTVLARLNARARYYVAEDISNGKPLKVPNDFRAFKSWTPMPKYIPEAVDVPKLIVVVKDIPFLGWYENGTLLSDTEICIGKSEDWTRAGLYRVENKDANHISRSYSNAYGQPAPMPWALRIYEHVWIHAGDIATAYCSHGCINLPMMPAMRLFDWADSATPVLVLQSLKDLRNVLAANQSNCKLYASECSKRQPPRSD